MNEFEYDVVICGGGLAGLTLALQLSREAPDTRVAIVERQQRPLPVAAHKVGESAVEIASEYLLNVLGLDSYIRDRHLPKFGLRFWLGRHGLPLRRRVEYGPRDFPLVPSLHLDRGILEQDLRDMTVDAGTALMEGRVVDRIELGKDGARHRITVRDLSTGDVSTLSSRWVVDATGRRRLLQCQLGLSTDAAHHCSAAWWRVKGIYDVARLLGADAATTDRRGDVERWLSTNHLMGRGYWVWLIPLPSEHMSIGIVSDEHIHPISGYNSSERAMGWLRATEPDLASFLEGSEVEDFYALKNFSYWSKQVFSVERWACVGDAGVFSDPLYSPGSDFTAFTNTLTTRLILDDGAGRLDPETVSVYNRLVLSDVGENTLALYRQNYATFGSTRVTIAKTHWDTCYYWAFPGALFFNGHFDREVLKRYSRIAQRFLTLNGNMQRLFREWADRAGNDGPEERAYIAYSGMPFFRSLQAELAKRKSPDDMLAVMHANLNRFESWAIVMTRHVVAECMPEYASRIAAASIDPYHASLDPASWAGIEQSMEAEASAARYIEEMGAQARAFISAPCSWAS